MKLVKPLLSILISLIFTLTSYAQDEFSGTVTKVIDGKTLVVEPHRGPEITLELQYIEVPEPGQKLYQIVKEHLKKLALNKQVKFIMKSLTNGKTYGRVFTDDGWLGEQMIRDGAAWYALPQKAGHDKTESEIYLKNESLARSEKRGIWSIEGILPAWEFRAKKERLKHSAYQQIQKQDVKVLPASGRNAKALRNRRLTPEERDQANANTQIWADVSWYGLLMSNFDLLMRHEETGGGVESWNSFDPGVQSPFATRLSVVELFDGKKKDKVFGMLVFIGNVGSFIGETPSPDNTISFFLFLSKSTNEKFSNAKTLTLGTGKEKVTTDKMIRKVAHAETGVQDAVFYMITQRQLDKIKDAKSVKFKMGKYNGTLNKSFMSRIKALMEELTQ